MGLAGELSTIGLAEVFSNLAFSQLTGTLTVELGERKAHVCFEQGRIRAVSAVKIDYVEVARLAGAAPEEMLEKAAGKKRRRTLKAFLASGGGFDEARYDAAVAARVEDEILPLFGWTAGSFSFEEGKTRERLFDKEQLGCAVDLDPQGVAMEAARRHDEWQTIEAFVPSEKDVLVPADGQPEGEAEPLLELADGTRTLAEVIEAARMKKHEALTAVARLVEAGRVVVATPKDLLELASRARMAGDVSLAVRRLEVSLDLDPARLDARRELVKLYERSARKSDAARELIKIADLTAERGDMQAAREALERAAILAPGDLDTLERIFRFHEARGRKTRYLRAGESLAAALLSREMYEDALPLYKRLLAENQSSESVRGALADCLVLLDEPAKAAQHLLVLAERCFEQRVYTAARRAYRRVLTVDPECAEAHARIEEIESGEARARDSRRKRRRVMAGVVVVCGLLATQLVREWRAQSALHEAQSAAALRLAADNSDRARVEALRHYADVCKKHGFTRSAAHARETLRGLLAAELKIIDAALELAPEARTTADIAFSLGRAEGQLARIDKIDLPADAAELWHKERRRILSVIAKLRG